MKGLFKHLATSEILAAVETERRTGQLRVRHSDRTVDLWFRDGVLARVESATRPREERLGTILVRAEKLQPKDLDGAIVEQRREARPLGRILVERGLMTEPLLARFLRLQAQDTVHAVLHWRDGSHEFTAGALPPGDGLGDVKLSCQALRDETTRRAREWPRIRQIIPSSETCFRVRQDMPIPEAETPGSLEDDLVFDGLSEAFGEQASISRPPLVNLGDAERTVFALVEPGVDVRHLVDRSELGEFGTCEALSLLVRAGYLEVVEPALELDL